MKWNNSSKRCNRLNRLDSVEERISKPKNRSKESIKTQTWRDKREENAENVQFLYDDWIPRRKEETETVTNKKSLKKHDDYIKCLTLDGILEQKKVRVYIVTTICKSLQHCMPKLEICIPSDAAIPPLQIYLTEMSSHFCQKNNNVKMLQLSTNHNSPKLETDVYQQYNG